MLPAFASASASALFSFQLVIVIVIVVASAYADEIVNISVSAANYDYWCVGNCNARVTTTPRPGIVLMGGGTDVDAAFEQQIAWSDCGDFLVIRASGTDAYNSYIYGLGCANSVATLLLKNKAGASDQFVTDTINEAEAIFFAGGNQWTYVNEWMGSPLQAAVQAAIDTRNVPVGGTSAGCMVQTGHIFDAEHGSVYSDEALSDPYNHYMTFSQFLVTQKYQLLNSTISDTHFYQRDRFGRFLAFVARMNTDNSVSGGQFFTGIALNERTALAIDLTTLVGTMLGIGSSLSLSNAYIVTPDAVPEICAKQTPLIFANVRTQKLEAAHADTFDFATWTGGSSANSYLVSAVNGAMKGDPYNP